MSAYCNQCGNALPQAARFCSVCGTVVNGVPFAGAYGSAPGYGPGWTAGYPPYAPRLTRPIFGREFAGVCAGLARTYGWDVGLVRIFTVLGAVFLCPIAELAYLACWIGIPEEQLGDITANQAPASTPQPPQA